MSKKLTAAGDVADACDECGRPIPWEVTCYAMPTGETFEGKPVVRINCADCYAGAST